MPIQQSTKKSKDQIINELNLRISELEKQKSEDSLIRLLTKNSKELISLVQQYLQNHIQLNNAEIKFSIRMTIIATIIILAIIAVSAFLTLKGKIDGSTFTFLLGLIVGYVLTFIRQSINPDDN